MKGKDGFESCLEGDQYSLVTDDGKTGHQWHFKFLAWVTTLVPSTDLGNTRFVGSGSCVWFWTYVIA